MQFVITSDTMKKWLEVTIARRAELLNPAFQMSKLLDAVREDVDKQFDENQGQWTPLRPYTVEKKARLNADPRILHETKVGEGLRLRDAYKQAGEITPDGKLVYSYPEEKPYAKDHQEGLSNSGNDSDSGKPKPKKPTPTRKRQKLSPHVARELKHLDEEFERKIRHRD